MVRTGSFRKEVESVQVLQVKSLVLTGLFTLFTLAASSLSGGVYAEGSVPSTRFDTEKYWRSSEIKRGMKGYGLTVFQGTEIERFEVEILGVIENEFTDTDLILALCSGGPLAKTGVIAGMSGSPIYIEDRLVGALAYAWSFSKDPIAGITPIENMLPILDYPATENPSYTANREAHSSLREASTLGVRVPGRGLSREVWESRFNAFLQKDYTTAAALHDRAVENPLFPDSKPSPTFQPPAGGLLETFQGSGSLPSQGWVPIATPLMVSGLSTRVLDQVSGLMGPMGLLPMPGGLPSAVDSDLQKVQLAPGSGIGVALVGGDLKLAGIGTVTYVDGDSVLGFGHPMFGDGSTDVPMTTAYINTVLPTLSLSTKMGGMIRTVGALEQDRLAGIGGTVGGTARTLPLKVHLTHKAAELDRTFEYDVAYHRFYTPRFSFFCALDAIDVFERSFRDSTAHYTLTVRLKGREPLVLRDEVSSPGGTAISIGLVLSSALDLLMRNPYEEVEIEGVDLEVGIVDRLRQGSIEWISLDRQKIQPGDSFSLDISVQPWLGKSEVLRETIELPEKVEAGSLMITVSDASRYIMEKMMRNPDRYRPRDIESLLTLLGESHPNNEVYVTVSAMSLGLSEFGRELPDLPSSVLRVMADSPQRGQGGFVMTELVAEETIRLDRPLSGQQRILVEVEPSRSNRLN